MLEGGESMAKYYIEGITHIIEADPSEISIKLIGDTLKSANVNGVNGTYFDVANPANTNTVWGIAVQDGKPIGSGVTASYQGYKRGTIYYTQDGKLDIAMANSISELSSNLKWAISGCMIYPAFDYTSQGFIGNHSDVWNHTCNRTGIGIKGGKVYLFARENTDINRFIQTCQNLGLEKAVMLDSGGSTQLNWNGQGIASTRKISTAVVVQDSQAANPPASNTTVAKNPVIVIDPGHGGSDPGAVANNLKEKDITLDIALKLNDLLKNYEANAILTRTNDIDVGLAQRANVANSANATLFVSIHVNAGGGTGFESYRHPNASDKTASIQTIIHREVAKFYVANGFTDRGMKTANYEVLRETTMPAILLENLFIDTANDANFLKDDKNKQAIAQAICDGIVQALGLKAKAQQQPQQSNINYTVQVGAFSDINNANKLKDELISKGYPAFVKKQ
jgi:N-acetylmuramoyl-L-alanine amidase